MGYSFTEITLKTQNEPVREIDNEGGLQITDERNCQRCRQSSG
jgi:hypothetical protein